MYLYYVLVLDMILLLGKELMVNEGIHKRTGRFDVKIWVQWLGYYVELFYELLIVLIFPIPILSQGFKEHGWPNDSVAIQKGMWSKRCFLCSLIALYTYRISQRKALVTNLLELIGPVNFTSGC